MSICTQDGWSNGSGSTQMGRFLSHHFGDRMVYLTGAADKALLKQAVAKGLVTVEGYLTRAGYRFWRHYGN
ncbi:MAG: hypothetical protein HOI95_14660 [Chromatiales bacterium]|jgi:hypothetical protein|nr:hypothetical protein [Chromatiales bacterium]